MAINSEKSKILVFGATGYLGQYMVKASVSLGHPTFAYVRPLSPKAHPSKLQPHKELESLGVTIFQGNLDEHEKLVAALKQVDVVISTLAAPQHLEQLKIIKAMEEAGNIKRFVPSEYGNEVDRVSGLPPFEALLANKRKVRRATEAAGLSHTYVSANSFGAYFVDYLLHPNENREEVVVYGSGEAKAVLNYEGDVATYTVKAATDPRVANRVIIYRPPGNIISQLELISSWEKKTGRTLKRVHVPEEEIVKLSETLPIPDNISVSVLHNIFIKGDQLSQYIFITRQSTHPNRQNMDPPAAESSNLLRLLFLCFVLIAKVTCTNGTLDFQSPSQKVSLELYYESLCPYCSNFIVNYIGQLFHDQELLSIVELKLVPYGNAKIRPNNTITCQHGPNECLLNTVEACAINIWPDLIVHFPFIYCVEALVYKRKFLQWESCFNELGLDPKPIEDCYKSEYGKELELQYAAETNALQPPHKYVPWVVVDGQPLYEDYENFMNYVCKAYKGQAVPRACSKLAEADSDMGKKVRSILGRVSLAFTSLIEKMNFAEAI